MSGEDPAASRVRRMLPSVSEVLKELTARAPIEPDVAFRVAREVCAEELKRIRDAGGDSVPLEDLVQRALRRATGGMPAPPPVASGPVSRPVTPGPMEPAVPAEPEPPREPREAGAVEDPFAETTGAMDLRWEGDAREPFSEPQPFVPPPSPELPGEAGTAVEAPVLPPLSFEDAPVPEPRSVPPEVPDAPEGFGDETLSRLSREAESIDLKSVFPMEAGPVAAPDAFPGREAPERAGRSVEAEAPAPFEDDEDTVLTIPRGGRSGLGGAEVRPRIGVVLGVVVGLAALGGLGYLLAGLWMERDAVPPPVAVARPRPEAPPSPVPAASETATPVPAAPAAVPGSTATPPAPAPEPVFTVAAAPATPRPAVPAVVATPGPAPTAIPTIRSAAAPPVRQSRDGLVVTRDRAGQPQVYSIHFTSYQERAKAERDLKRVEALAGRDGYVAEVDLGARGVWQRVMIGTFATMEEAKAVREELAAKGTRDMGWVYRVVGPETP